MTDRISDLTDVALLERHQAESDRAALGELYTRHYGAVRRVIGRLVSDGSLADDLTQEVFRRAIGNLASLRDGERFRHWLLGIATNTVKQERRNWARRPGSALIEDWNCLIDEDAPEGIQASVRSEFENLLDRELQNLPLRLREPIVLRHCENLSLAEIGRVLGRKKSTVQSQVEKGLARLRAAFEQGGHAAMLPMLSALAPSAAEVGAGPGSIRAVDWTRRAMAAAALVLAVVAVGVILDQGESWARPEAGVAVSPKSVTSKDASTLAADARLEMPRPRRELARGGAGGPRVFGQVFDAATQQPLAGVEVKVFDYARQETWSVETDAEGEFNVPQTKYAPGLFHLKADHPAIDGEYRYGAEVCAGIRASTQPLRIELKASMWVRTRIVGARGGPIPEQVRVQVVDHETDYWPSGPGGALVRTLPDDLRVLRDVELRIVRGLLTVGGVPGGGFELWLTATGYCPAVAYSDWDMGFTAPLLAAPTPREAAFDYHTEMVRSKPRRLFVLDRETGAAVFGAVANGDPGSVSTNAAYVDSPLDSIGQRPRTLTAPGRPIRHRFPELDFDHRTGEEPPNEVFLGHGARVSGRVVGREGETLVPLSGHIVIATDERAGLLTEPLGVLLTDANGEFSFPALPTKVDDEAAVQIARGFARLGSGQAGSPRSDIVGVHRRGRAERKDRSAGWRTWGVRVLPGGQ